MIKILIIFINFLFTQALTDISFIGSKSLGAAGAVVSNPNDVECVFYNPAGLYNKEKTTFLVGNTQLYQLDFLEHQYLSFGFRNGLTFTYQQLGTSYKGSSFLNSGDYATYGFYNMEGFLSKEKSLTISQGFLLRSDMKSKFSIGYSLNHISVFQNRSAGPSGDGQNGLPSKNYSSNTLDVGIYASLREKISFGAYAKNISNAVLAKGSSVVHLPRRLDIGMTYIPSDELIATFALERVLGYDKSSFRFGIEYIVSKTFLIRSGIQINPNRLGAGFSYKFKKLELSYSLLTHPVLSITDVFNLKVYFE